MDDVLIEKIREYRRMLKLDKPDLDVSLLLKIFNITNESSEVFVAIEPVSETGEWVSNTPKYAVRGLKKLDDGRLVLSVNADKHGIAAGDLHEQYRKALKHASGSGVPVLFMRGDEITQITEAFSHALLKDQWSGLPFDIVLGVRKRAVVPVEEDTAENN